MKNKIRKPLFTLFLIVLVSACGSVSIVKVQSDADDAYLKQQYGEYATHWAGVVEEYGFKRTMEAIRNGIIENRKLNDNQREAEIEKLNAMKYVKNGYLAFEILTHQPLYQKQYNLKFNIADKKGTLLQSPMYFIYQKQLWARGRSSGTFYVYTWFFPLRKTLDAMQPGELPLKLSVTYPNDRTNAYSFKP